MIFETAITRHPIPSTSNFSGVTSSGIDGWWSHITPPPSHDDWRFREFKLLDAVQYTAGYTVSSGFYSVPPTSSVPQCEILVIWERVKSIEKGYEE